MITLPALVVGATVSFNYKGKTDEVRQVRIETVRDDIGIIVGQDELRDGGYRSFNVKYMSNVQSVEVAPNGWDSVQTSVE